MSYWFSNMHPVSEVKQPYRLTCLLNSVWKFIPDLKFRLMGRNLQWTVGIDWDNTGQNIDCNWQKHRDIDLFPISYFLHRLWTTESALHCWRNSRWKWRVSLASHMRRRRSSGRPPITTKGSGSSLWCRMNKNWTGPTCSTSPRCPLVSGRPICLRNFLRSSGTSYAHLVVSSVLSVM